jgi:hypothetical protein
MPLKLHEPGAAILQREIIKSNGSLAYATRLRDRRSSARRFDPSEFFKYLSSYNNNNNNNNILPMNHPRESALRVSLSLLFTVIGFILSCYNCNHNYPRCISEFFFTPFVLQSRYQ